MSDIDKQKPEPRTETEKVNREEKKLPNDGVSPDYTDADREGEGKRDERD